MILHQYENRPVISAPRAYSLARTVQKRGGEACASPETGCATEPWTARTEATRIKGPEGHARGRTKSKSALQLLKNYSCSDMREKKKKPGCTSFNPSCKAAKPSPFLKCLYILTLNKVFKCCGKSTQ